MPSAVPPCLRPPRGGRLMEYGAADRPRYPGAVTARPSQPMPARPAVGARLRSHVRPLPRPPRSTSPGLSWRQASAYSFLHRLFDAIQFSDTIPHPRRACQPPRAVSPAAARRCRRPPRAPRSRRTPLPVFPPSRGLRRGRFWGTITGVDALFTDNKSFVIVKNRLYSARLPAPGRPPRGADGRTGGTMEPSMSPGTATRIPTPSSRPSLRLAAQRAGGPGVHGRAHRRHQRPDAAGARQVRLCAAAAAAHGAHAGARPGL